MHGISFPLIHSIYQPLPTRKVVLDIPIVTGIHTHTILPSGGAPCVTLISWFEVIFLSSSIAQSLIEHVLFCLKKYVSCLKTLLLLFTNL